MIWIEGVFSQLKRSIQKACLPTSKMPIEVDLLTSNKARIPQGDVLHFEGLINSICSQVDKKNGHHSPHLS